MKDKKETKKLSTKDKLYYKTFNAIYYDHKKPTEEDCQILNIPMEKALELRKEGTETEYNQRNDAMGIADFGGAEKYEKVSKFTERPNSTDIVAQHIEKTKKSRKIRNDRSNLKAKDKKNNP